MNFIGVIAGGIAVAYALIELLPPNVLSPPNGSPAVTTLVALFASACFWNIATWSFGIPNSSSHCIVGARIGVRLATRSWSRACSVFRWTGPRSGVLQSYPPDVADKRLGRRRGF